MINKGRALGYLYLKTFPRIMKIGTENISWIIATHWAMPPRRPKILYQFYSGQ